MSASPEARPHNVVAFRLPEDEGGQLTPLGDAVLAALRLRTLVDTLSVTDRRKLAPRLNELTADVAAHPGLSTDAHCARWLLDRLTGVWDRLSATERAALAPELRQMASVNHTA